MDDVDPVLADRLGERAALRRMTSGFFVASGRVMCVAPARASSRSIGPPAEATIGGPAGGGKRARDSIVPRSTPPETRLGITCSTAGGAALCRRCSPA